MFRRLLQIPHHFSYWCFQFLFSICLGFVNFLKILNLFENTSWFCRGHEKYIYKTIFHGLSWSKSFWKILWKIGTWEFLDATFSRFTLRQYLPREFRKQFLSWAPPWQNDFVCRLLQIQFFGTYIISSDDYLFPFFMS